MPSSTFEVDPVVMLPAGLKQLPLHVRPALNEALVSWSWRLASRFAWSLAVLARDGFQLTEALTPDWWARPKDALLAILELRTGVEFAQLRRMTFLDWAPVVLDGTERERVAGRRFDAPPPDRKERVHAVCTECLRGDDAPYLRQAWLFEWTAVCEAHGSELLTRCPECQRPLKTPTHAYTTKFLASRCDWCAADLTRADSRAAPQEIHRLQEVLLTGKRTGKTVLPRIGCLDWSELITLCDVLLEVIWKEMSPEDRQPLLLISSSNSA